jgi:uncharacterized protein (TIGR02996 family)
MRSFLLEDAGSKHFWNIDLKGTRLTVIWGRVGSKGLSQTKTLADPTRARAEYDKLIREKKGKGYVEQVAAPLPLVQQLEEAILDNPRDRASYAALADYLMEQSDPLLTARGEFIRVLLALEEEGLSPSVREELHQREKELLEAHQDEWVGDWANLGERRGPFGRGQLDFPTPTFDFERGILSTATIESLTVACARAFVREPQTRMIQRLYLGSWAYEEPGEYDVEEEIADDDVGAPSRPVLSLWPHFANLRVFQLGWTSDEDYGGECWWQCHLSGQGVCDLVEKMPRLEELYLFADSIDTKRLFSLPTLNHLRILQVYHCWEYPLEELAGNPALGNLTHLLLHPKADGAWSDDAPYIKLAGIRAILRSPHLGRLSHLRLRMAEVGDEGCQEIVDSGALRHLKVLDLRHGTITDEGARILAECPAVEKLELLDLTNNELTAEGIELLKGVVANLRVGHQQGEGGARDYLMQGDYE